MELISVSGVVRGSSILLSARRIAFYTCAPGFARAPSRGAYPIFPHKKAGGLFEPGTGHYDRPYDLS